MLAIVLCGYALTAPALPDPTWLEASARAYRCQASLEARPPEHLLENLPALVGLPDRPWHLVYAPEAARGRDGLVLPADPSSVLTRPGLRHSLRAAVLRGAVPVLDARGPGDPAALATLYSALGLTPRAALIRPDSDAPPNLRGTFLTSSWRGLPLPGLPLQAGENTYVPLTDQQAGAGQYASTTAPATRLDLSPTLSWTFAGQRYPARNREALSAAQAIRATLPTAWYLSLAVWKLPNLTALLTRALAWLSLILGVALLLALALRSLTARRTAR
ncbi:hypothetical protein HNR42_003617 [Deinobacterium chartae]|uniref:Uncharacterized protein n=1 Tax=Deinobacterium chartae TaxID=521158 RepID=A0A841I3A4_9DEIO|nr:hypothetical protein [Deinobacterium chartae]MBB6100147.1 hypothetical protein [Deinobacterium chartae]